jgi:hypothetical protein
MFIKNAIVCIDKYLFFSGELVTVIDKGVRRGAFGEKAYLWRFWIVWFLPFCGVSVSWAYWFLRTN